MTHNHTLYLQKDLERFALDEHQHYAPVSLSEECSGPPPGWEEPIIPLPLDFLGPPDWLNSTPMEHQRRRNGRDQLEKMLSVLTEERS